MSDGLGAGGEGCCFAGGPECKESDLSPSLTRSLRLTRRSQLARPIAINIFGQARDATTREI